MVEGIGAVVQQGLQNDKAQLAQLVQQLDDKTQFQGAQALLPQPIDDFARRALSNEAEHKGAALDIVAGVLYALPTMYAITGYLLR